MSAKRSGTPGPPAWLPEQLQQLVDSLESIRSDMVGLEATLLEPGRDIHSSYAPSAANLLHYLALRRHDVRQLQEQLAGLGLSSLGRAESHVLGTLDSVLRILSRLADSDREPLPERPGSPIRFNDGKALLERHTEALLGPKPPLRSVRIMVTMPSEAAHVPVIWATQVLETFANSGMPSRAEITDAAMGERAECVMLNKGPHILDAIRVLDNILQRMEAHQSKKRSMLRRLHWWNKSKATVKP